MAIKPTEQAEGSWEEQMSAFGGHPLDTYLGTAKALAAAEGGGLLQQLADLGVTDVEQLVALANSNAGRENLAATVGLAKEEIEHLFKEAKKALPPHLAAELEHPLPPMYGLGVLEPTPEMLAAAEAEAVTEAYEAVALPTTVNLVARMSPIRNQGARGTCVAFGLTAINEYYQRWGRRRSQDLSEQHLYHECKLVDGAPAACGTWQRIGAQVLKARSHCRESVWSYNPNPPCNNNGTMPANARTDAANFKVVLTEVPTRNVAAIKSYLASRKPVAVSIPVYNSWYTSPETKRTGRITMPLVNDPQVGGHVICLVGYQDSTAAPGGGYFILRNSWSTNWGSQCPYGPGYGTIPYQYIANYNWEAFTLSAAVSAAEEPTPGPGEEGDRTITITVRSNIKDVNLVIE